MKRMLPALCALSLLTACSTTAESTAPSVTPAPSPAAATPAPTAAPTSTPAVSSAPTPAPTAMAAPTTTLEEWTAVLPEQRPDYSIEERPYHLEKDVAWPEQPVTLQIDSWKGTLEEAAEAFGVSLEALQAMNPDPETWTDPDSGAVTYYNLKLQDNYVVPKPEVRYVTVSTPWVEYSIERTDTYMVPAALSDQAAACMATAYDFQYEHYGMHLGIEPSELLPGDDYTYCVTDGALYTTYTDLEQFLGGVYTPDRCADLLGGPLSQKGERDTHPYYQGENDTICYQMGDRGSNIQYCGKSFTEPEIQPDGSIQFWQLSLMVESDDFVGWGEGITYTPDTASASIVRLEPSETGWRVASLDLPN